MLPLENNLLLGALPPASLNRLRDLFGAHALDLEHDEHDAVLKWHGVQDTLQLFRLTGRGELPLGRGRLRAQRFQCRPIRHQFLTAEMGLSAVPGRDAETDLVKPRRNRALAGEGAQAPVHDQKHFLVDVFDVRRAYTHTVECPPHELSVTLVHLRDR